MAGSGRRDAMRKASKKNIDGFSDQGRSLRSKGPTPKAEDRVYHATHKWTNEKHHRDSGRHKRKGDGTKLVVGRNSAVGCLHAKMPAAALIMALGTDNDERLQGSVRIANSHGIPIRGVPRHELDTMTDNTIRQGIGLQIPSYKYSSVEDLIDSVAEAGESGPIVRLDSITSPRNPGAIIRSVAVFGGYSVVIPERRSAAVMGVAWRTSAGTTTRLPVARTTNMVRSFKQFQKAGYQIVGLDTNGDHTLDICDGITPVVVVVGSEGKSLSRLAHDTCDTIIPIPMTGWVESLNASVAAGITLSELARQRQAKSSQ